jgi:hypothetical protein
MPAIEIQILRFVDENQPGWVECALVDSVGVKHLFVEKIPVVSTENLSLTSNYPCSGSIQCDVEEEWKDKDGNSVARISTERPWGVESTTGIARFVVLSSQIVRQ